MPVLVVRISDQEGTDLLANTVTNFSGGKFYDEKCVESKDIILSVDSIVEVRLREGQNAQFIIADNADMDVSEITSTLNCKFVQFIIAQQLALTSSSACKEPNPC